MSSQEYLFSKTLLLEILQKHQNGYYFPVFQDYLVKFFKREFKFLDIFLSLNNFTDEPDMLDLTQQVHGLFQDALDDISKIYRPNDFDFYARKVETKIWSTKLAVRAKYSVPKISLPFPVNKDGIPVPRLVMDFMDTVVENLRDLVKLDSLRSWILYVPELNAHVNDVLKELKLLQIFICFISEGLIDPQRQHHHVHFLNHVFAVAGHTSMLSWLYLKNRSWGTQGLDPHEIKSLLSDFLRTRIKPTQPCIRKIYVDFLQALKSDIQSGCYPNYIRNERLAKSEVNFVETALHNLVEILTNSEFSKDHLPMLKEMLNFLRANVNRALIQDLELLLRDTGTVIVDVGLLIYSEDIGMGNIQHIYRGIYLITRKVFQSQLPKIHGLGYFDFLLNNLKEFQGRFSDSLTFVRKQLQKIQMELESLQPFLEGVVEEQHKRQDKLQSCAALLIGKAHEIEYIIDACICKEVPIWCVECWLLDIMEEITLIRGEVAENGTHTGTRTSSNTGTARLSSNLSRSSSRINEEIVGFEDVIEKLRDQLITGTRGRDVISIVGMPGLGKTTLAYKIYSDMSVISHFDIRAQCCVSQAYSRKGLLLAILNGAKDEDYNRTEKPVDELADELRKALLYKRYLILIDDAWEASVWEDLIGCLVDSNNGSRVIITTRNHGVANYVRYESDPLPLRMFTDEESWKLLKKKVFGEENCPQLLMSIGKQIAKMCGQLPLSVVLVAGILAKMEKKEEIWEQVANNLGPHIHNDSRAIIEHSYQSLPYHMKSCLLYFGAFLEDSVINVSKLTWLWISEGFVKSCQGKSLEDIAEDYLENLIERNLVMGMKRSSRGNIKECRIHDVLRDFYKERAKEENLLQWIKWDQLDNQLDNLSSHVYPHKKLPHRMSIYGEGYRITERSSSWSLVSSIILHINGTALVQDSHIFHSFKFLKVLDLEFTRIDSFPTDLIYLRYFAAATTQKSIPPSISNLCNLETLISNNGPKYVSLPVTLWEMVKLRHLHTSHGIFAIENADKLPENSTKLYDMETLSSAYFPSVKDAESILRRTPNLRKLRCEFKGVTDFQDRELNFPTRLEKLKVHLVGSSIKIIPFCISAPNLQNLALDYVHLVPYHLSSLALLENLQVLKLEFVRFSNNQWDVRHGEFPQLKVMKLQNLFLLEEWTVAEDAFPKLEHLVLRECEFLKEIPSCFGDFCSLKSIEVRACNESLAKSARDIRQTQVEDYQNSEFELTINGRVEIKSDSVGGGDDDDVQEEDEY